MRSLVGTGALLRLALRLDRVRLAIWVAAITLVVVSTASAFQELYPTTASRELFAAGVAANPSLSALLGPAYDLSTIGGLTAWRVGTIGAVLVAIMNILTVTRHTRAEEETGRLELVGSGVVGRHAPLTAALALAFAADAVLALTVGAGLTGFGLPATGAFAFGASLAAAGAVFAALAAVTAQLTDSTRTASGMAFMVLAVSYLLRAVGDSAAEGGPTWLSWLSPIGWSRLTRPFADERWWVFALPAAAVLLLAAASYVLVGRRDIDAGLLPQRPGPAEASPALRSPLALAWRLQRGVLAAWIVGFALLGSAFGSVAEGIGDLLRDSPQMEEILAALGGQQGVVDAYLAATMGIAGIIASAYAVQATLRLRSEETALRAEPILATRVGRVQWVLSHLVIALAGTAVLLLVAGLAAGLFHGLRIADVGGQTGRLLQAALVQLPAAWVLAGIAVALFGLAPTLVVGAWALLVAFLLLGQLGPVLQLDQWLMDLSPFTHVPALPGGEATVTPLLWLLLAFGALTVAGLAGFRRRDVG